MKHLRKNSYVNSCLQDLILRNNFISNVGASHLCKMLSRQNNIVRYLDLSKNPLGDKGVEGLVNGLKRHEHLEVINLFNCKIGCQGARKIGKMLSKNISLKFLILDYNEIKNRGIKAIGEGLEINKTLLALHIRDNPIEDQEVVDLSKSILLNTVLNDLQIHGNLISFLTGSICHKNLSTKKTL